MCSSSWQRCAPPGRINGTFHSCVALTQTQTHAASTPSHTCMHTHTFMYSFTVGFAGLVGFIIQRVWLGSLLNEPIIIILIISLVSMVRVRC
jgi:hypothetical protein